MQRWQSMCYIMDAADCAVSVRRTININGRVEPVLSVQEINAACNTSIILTRMVAQGRARWRMR